ncbi:MAG: agmatinase [Candidatus Woesearchaeota archaeon]|jgi:agmatinase
MEYYTYGGLGKEYTKKDSSKIVIIPVPYDGTSTWIKGANKGPKALIEASMNMELYDIETDSEVFKKGIFTENEIKGMNTPEKMVELVRKKVKEHIDSKFVVTLGGEHSISIGPIMAHVAKYKNLTVLQLDAHSDTREEYEGSKFNHACVMARARELCPIVQVGIRSLDAGEKIDKKRIFFAEKIYDNDKWMDDAIALLSENVYLTIDLDAFDPSYLPSTGTPEPGGMQWYQVLKFLRKVIEKKNLVGLDVVELCPNKNDKASDFLAAKLVYKILTYKFELLKK